ncbi:hypothetical protein DYB31_004741 [Aphanomyces astaci]|uniref:Amidohydrolase-related domain-containing protein n=1 Tax=Aphanomyces astaci TaxID=112090 RepID=A0A397FE07_APHAT|nr:hypothetical protein DYB31_004741 [Aphanomyces astaci]
MRGCRYARNMYTKAVTRHVLNGTTTCSYFATIHLEACKVLADIVHDIGQRGYLGKVNMDRNATPELTESTHGSLADTTSFIEYIATKHNSLLTPVITPRFVPRSIVHNPDSDVHVSCSTSSALMTGLAALSNTHTLPIQSHLSENAKEIEWVQALHPDCSSYAEVRPNSNFSLSSGVLNVRQLLNEGVKVGLGTDVSAGYSTSMLDAIRHAVIASKVTALTSPTHQPLTYAEAFHLATVGSAACLGLHDVVGNFVPGKELDMLVVDLGSINSAVDTHDHDDCSSRFQKFLFLGDDRNIVHVYVRGRRLVHLARTIEQVNKQHRIAQQGDRRTRNQREDVSGRRLTDEEKAMAAHHTFVRQLVDGSMRIPVRNPRRGDYDIMQVSIDAHLTLLTWSPLLSSPDARQASSAQTLELEDVVSIVPWTHKMPTKKPSAAELEMASKGGCWYFGVCVAYTKQQRTQQLMLLCHNAAEQEQLVLSFRTLIRNAKQRRSSLQLADAARLTPGMTASHMTPTQPAMPSQHIPLLVRR